MATAAKKDETVDAADSAGIRYKGADTRIISKADWEGIDVKGQDDVTWGMANGRVVPKSQLTKGAFDYLLNVDGQFEET